MPIRLRDVHIINAPSWIDKALAFFKPFLKKELYDMVRFSHHTYNHLLTYSHTINYSSIRVAQ